MGSDRDQSQRIRLEGQLELLEAALEQLSALAEALDARPRRAELGDLEPQLRLNAMRESSVELALESVSRCAAREAWPADSLAPRVARGVRDARAAVLVRLRQRLRVRGLPNITDAHRQLLQGLRRSPGGLDAEPSANLAVDQLCAPLRLTDLEREAVARWMADPGGEARVADRSGPLVQLGLDDEPRAALITLVLALTPVRSQPSAQLDETALYVFAEVADRRPDAADWRRVFDLLRVLVEARELARQAVIPPLYRSLRPGRGPGRPRRAPATLADWIALLAGPVDRSS